MDDGQHRRGRKALTRKVDLRGKQSQQGQKPERVSDLKVCCVISEMLTHILNAPFRMPCNGRMAVFQNVSPVRTAVSSDMERLEVIALFTVLLNQQIINKIIKYFISSKSLVISTRC